MQENPETPKKLEYDPKLKVCVYCKKEFYTVQPLTKYCSSACKNRAQSDRRRKSRELKYKMTPKPAVPVRMNDGTIKWKSHCMNCGAELISSCPSRHYCNAKCKEQFYRIVKHNG